MLDFNDPHAVEAVRVRRCDTGTEEILADVWGSRAWNVFTSDWEADGASVLNEKFWNACERRKRARCRGTVWMVVGALDVGKRTVMKAVADELKQKADVKFMSVLQVKSYHLKLVKGGEFDTTADSMVNADQFDRVEASLRYTTLLREGGERYAVPLDVITFLSAPAGSGAPRTVLLLAPPALYLPLMQQLPHVAVKVLHITCPGHVIEERKKKSEIGRLAMVGKRSHAAGLGLPQQPAPTRSPSDALSPPTAPAIFVSGSRERSPSKTGRRRSSTAMGPAPAQVPSPRSAGKKAEQYPWQQSCDLDAFGIPQEIVEAVDNNRPIGHTIGHVLEVLGFG